MAGRPNRRIKTSDVAQGVDPERGTSAAPGLPTIKPNPNHVRPRNWPQMPADERLEFTFGCALDNLFTLISFNPDELDHDRFVAWKEASLAVVTIGAKFGLQRARTTDAEHLAEVKRRLAERIDQS